MVDQIRQARFLQFSSSHTVITGFSGGRPLVDVRDRGRDAYHVGPDARALDHIVDSTLAFVFLVGR